MITAAMCAIGAGTIGFLGGSIITMLIIEMAENEMEIRELKRTLEDMKR
jgi:hypothetical protein